MQWPDQLHPTLVSPCQGSRWTWHGCGCECTASDQETLVKRFAAKTPRSKIHCPLPYGPAERAQAETQRLRRFHTEGHRNGAQSLPIFMIFYVPRHDHSLCRGTVALAHLQPMHRCSREPWGDFLQGQSVYHNSYPAATHQCQGTSDSSGMDAEDCPSCTHANGEKLWKNDVTNQAGQKVFKRVAFFKLGRKISKKRSNNLCGGGKFGRIAFSNLYWIFGLLRINYANLTGTVQGLSTLKHAQLVNLHQFLSHEKKWKSTVPHVAKHPSITYIIKQKTGVSLHSRHHNFSHTCSTYVVYLVHLLKVRNVGWLAIREDWGLGRAFATHMPLAKQGNHRI